jgi:hypothetical protein
MPEVLGVLTVTVVPVDADTDDRYGNPTALLGTTFELAGCNLQQKTTDELRGEAGTTLTEWILFTPDPDPEAVRARDLIRIDPASLAHVAADENQTYATFDLEGEPDFLENIDGTVHHLELVLRRSQL